MSALTNLAACEAGPESTVREATPRPSSPPRLTLIPGAAPAPKRRAAPGIAARRQAKSAIARRSVAPVSLDAAHSRELLERYTPLVRKIAGGFQRKLPRNVLREDLLAAGMGGLWDAIRRHGQTAGDSFEWYVRVRVRGAILDELRAQDWVPRSVRGRARELERVQERLEGKLRRGPTDRELAAELGVTVGDLAGLTKQVQLVSVEALHESGGAVSELLTDDDAPDPVSVVQARETMRQLSMAVGQLGERDQLVVRLYYLENRTLAEIGTLLGVTESRVCQLHTRLVGRLRGRLEELAAG